MSDPKRPTGWLAPVPEHLRDQVERLRANLPLGVGGRLAWCGGQGCSERVSPGSGLCAACQERELRERQDRKAAIARRLEEAQGGRRRGRLSRVDEDDDEGSGRAAE